MKRAIKAMNMFSIEKLIEEQSLFLKQIGEKTETMFNVAIWIID